MPKSFIGSWLVEPAGGAVVVVVAGAVVVVAGAVVVVVAGALVVVVERAVDVVVLTAAAVVVVVAGAFVVGGRLVFVGRVVEVDRRVLVVVTWWRGCARGWRWLGVPEAPVSAKEFTRAATMTTTAALPAIARRRWTGLSPRSAPFALRIQRASTTTERDFR